MNVKEHEFHLELKQLDLGGFPVFAAGLFDTGRKQLSSVLSML